MNTIKVESAMKYEFMLVEVSIDGETNIDLTLDELGDMGWHIVGVLQPDTLILQKDYQVLEQV